MTERVVLAYSGGLDTSVAIGWIAQETGAEVVAVAVDVGQGGEDMDAIRKRALECGAVQLRDLPEQRQRRGAAGLGRQVVPGCRRGSQIACDDVGDTSGGKGRPQEVCRRRQGCPGEDARILWAGWC